ncbi:MAG: transglutaminaseTgpA domain-containing protein [Janthinobacterium lividum]
MATEIPTTPYQRPPWPAAVAALLAYAALALTSNAFVPLICLGLGLAASYVFRVRFENVTLTKWTLRIIVIGASVFGYLVTAVKDENAFFDVRYVYSFALAASAEMALQFWRREPTGGARAPFTVFLSAMIFLIGCSILDDTIHYLWYLAPAFFLFFMLALPGFRQRTSVSASLRYSVLPVLAALVLGGVIHAEFARNKDALNMLGSQALPGRHMSPSMGMSGQPILGSSFTLQNSFTRVLRIYNPGLDPYLRGMTFDTYSGHRWEPPLEARVFLTLPRQPRVNSGMSEQFVRLDDSAGLLFAPLHTSAIVPEAGQSLEWAARTEGPIRTPINDTDPLTYDITEGSTGFLDSPPTPLERAKDLAISPEIDPRVLALAYGLGDKNAPPEEKIAAIVHFLWTNNHYSLTVDPGQGEPISNFIIQHKSAHCEYFASAAVILLRAVGVPTRYVSGYFAHESDRKNSILVRQRDAHAWAESWIDGKGWVTVDATPSDGRPDALAGPIPFYWRAWEAVQDLLGAVRNWVVTASWAAKGSLFLLLVLGLLVPQVYRYLQNRRAITPGFRYTSTDAALAQMAVRFEAELTRRGIPCPEGRTWPEHLEITQAEDSVMLGFVRAYGYARFGPPPTRDDIALLNAALLTMEKTKLEKQVLEKTR